MILGFWLRQILIFGPFGERVPQLIILLPQWLNFKTFLGWFSLLKGLKPKSLNFMFFKDRETG